MREIKFRAWDKNHKKMWNFTGPHLCAEYDYLAWETVEEEDDELYDIVASDLEIMQFTGLKDKNGKEIYEGDIVMVRSQYNDEDGTPVNIESRDNVYFRDGAFRCTFHAMLLGEKVCTGSEGNWNMEVVGNIYENLELNKYA